MTAITSRAADVAFVIDGTGRMGEWIAGAHERVVAISQDCVAAQPDVDFRFACVCYRDSVDSPTDEHQVLEFVREVEEVRR